MMTDRSNPLDVAKNIVGMDVVRQLLRAGIAFVWHADVMQCNNCQDALSTCLAELTEARECIVELETEA